MINYVQFPYARFDAWESSFVDGCGGKAVLEEIWQVQYRTVQYNLVLYTTVWLWMQGYLRGDLEGGTLPCRHFFNLHFGTIEKKKN